MLFLPIRAIQYAVCNSSFQKNAFLLIKTLRVNFLVSLYVFCRSILTFLDRVQNLVEFLIIKTTLNNVHGFLFHQASVSVSDPSWFLIIQTHREKNLCLFIFALFLPYFLLGN